MSEDGGTLDPVLSGAREAVGEVPVEELAQVAAWREGSPRVDRLTDDLVEHPDPGEVVWCDDAGVSCRRWNWRPARRTQLRDDTTAALLILDALDPMTDQQLRPAADDLVARLPRRDRR